MRAADAVREAVDRLLYYLDVTDPDDYAGAWMAGVHGGDTDRSEDWQEANLMGQRAQERAAADRLKIRRIIEERNRSGS